MEKESAMKLQGIVLEHVLQNLEEEDKFRIVRKIIGTMTLENQMKIKRIKMDDIDYLKYYLPILHTKYPTYHMRIVEKTIVFDTKPGGNFHTHMLTYDNSLDEGKKWKLYGKNYINVGYSFKEICKKISSL